MTSGVYYCLLLVVMGVVVVVGEELWKKDMTEEIYIEGSTEGFELVSQQSITQS